MSKLKTEVIQPLGVLIRYWWEGRCLRSKLNKQLSNLRFTEKQIVEHTKTACYLRTENSKTTRLLAEHTQRAAKLLTLQSIANPGISARSEPQIDRIS